MNLFWINLQKIRRARTDDTANTITCTLIPGSVKRHKRAVTQAPTPKKNITNPGITSSRSNKTRPIINQITSGLEKIDSLIVIDLICIYEILLAGSKVKQIGTIIKRSIILLLKTGKQEKIA